jgi:hypothetical protein
VTGSNLLGAAGKFAARQSSTSDAMAPKRNRAIFSDLASMRMTS